GGLAGRCRDYSSLVRCAQRFGGDARTSFIPRPRTASFTGSRSDRSPHLAARRKWGAQHNKTYIHALGYGKQFQLRPVKRLPKPIQKWHAHRDRRAFAGSSEARWPLRRRFLSGHRGDQNAQRIVRVVTAEAQKAGRDPKKIEL